MDILWLVCVLALARILGLGVVNWYQQTNKKREREREGDKNTQQIISGYLFEIE